MPSLVFLGTSSGVPTKARNVSSYGFRLDDGRVILIDCGEGTQHQLGKCNDIKATKIDMILITHLHGDHSFGMPGLLASLSLFGGRSEPVIIIGPIGIKEYIETSIRLTATYLTYGIKIIEIPDTTSELGTFLGMKLTAFPLKHKVVSFGYLLEEPEKKGKLDAVKAKTLGITNPKDLGQLSAGRDVTLPDGKVIKSTDVTGETRKGKKYLFLGDTCDSDLAIEKARNCDILVHESTYDAASQEKALDGGHSTSAMAGQFAKKIEAKRMIITHFSAKYHGIHEKEPLTVKDLLVEAQRECPDIPVEAADDFAKFDIQ